MELIYAHDSRSGKLCKCLVSDDIQVGQGWVYWNTIRDGPWYIDRRPLRQWEVTDLEHLIKKRVHIIWK